MGKVEKHEIQQVTTDTMETAMFVLGCVLGAEQRKTPLFISLQNQEGQDPQEHVCITLLELKTYYENYDEPDKPEVEPSIIGREICFTVTWLETKANEQYEKFKVNWKEHYSEVLEDLPAQEEWEAHRCPATVVEFGEQLLGFSEQIYERVNLAATVEGRAKLKARAEAMVKHNQFVTLCKAADYPDEFIPTQEEWEKFNQPETLKQLTSCIREWADDLDECAFNK